MSPQPGDTNNAAQPGGTNDAAQQGDDHAPRASGPKLLSRRGLLLSGGGLGLGLVGGAAAASIATGGIPSAAPTPTAGHGAASGTASDSAPGTVGAPVAARGRTQAGIARPATPQRNTVVAVADVASLPDRAGLEAAFARVGQLIDELTTRAGSHPDVVPDDPADLTVTIGVGPRLVGVIDSALPGAAALPAFAGDTALDPQLSGGDVLVSVCGSDAGVLHAVVEAVREAWGDLTIRWMQAGVRGAGEGTIVRNPLGFHDGVIVPRTEDELDESVWIASGPAAGGTIAVVRRLRLDVDGFRAQSRQAQEATIGRRRMDGAPLSGGGATDQVDLTAKTAEGEYLVPVRSHARAAHPSFTGSGLMLRRGYAYSNAVSPGAAPDEGLLFVCFQNDLDVFVRTQRRLDETDDLMSFSTTTASASFLVVPGADGGPLGAPLFA